ncbi:MAG: alpha-E domain-containing protein [Isosphaeraceae bacterium]
MLSRAAESLFWMSRYLERAENVARLLDIGLYLELDAGNTFVDDGSAPVEMALTILGCRDAFRSTHPKAERTAVLGFLTFDRSNSQSILSMVARARENARGTQESIGVDAWSQVNRLYLYLCSQRAQRKFQASPSNFYTTIKQSCILFDGLIQNTLPRDEVYHFLRLGRNLERVDVMGRILHAKCHSLPGSEGGSEAGLELVRWTGLLRSCSAYGAYLRSERDRVEPVGVIRFLVLDPDFPRAIRFCVARCRESLREIAGGDEDEYVTEAERLLGRLESELRYIDVGEIFERGLLPFLNGIQTTCRRVGEEIQRTFFLV